jgi:5-formyltetrahydrofolate cyclo-ligase
LNPGAPDHGGPSRAALRRPLKQRRLDLPAAARIAAADAVAARFRADPELLGHPGYVAGYWAVSGELPLHALQLKLYPGQIWCLPCVHEDGTLGFAPWKPGDELATNRYGIPEPDVPRGAWLRPEEMHVVLVPLLAFDAVGHRLGTGGGYYDRSFAFRRTAPAPPWLVGVGYGFQRVDSLPAQAWDVPLDAVLADDAAWRFRR